MIGIKDQCFGVEVELTGITRRQAAHALANYFGTQARHIRGGYDTWTVSDTEGKEWKLMSDSSIKAERKENGRYVRTSDTEYRVEMVSPKLTYDKLPKFQECVRQVRHAGGKVNDSCGLHVHVDASNHNRQSLKNLISIMYSKEDILFKALQVNESRAARWCQKVREPMLQQARKLSSTPTKNLTQLEEIWYEGNVSSTEHYNWTRYYALNLHSVFYRGTVEWPDVPPPISTCVWPCPLRPLPSEALLCGKPAVTTKRSPSEYGWCGWDSTARSSKIPVTTFWPIWRATVRGGMTKTSTTNPNVNLTQKWSDDMQVIIEDLLYKGTAAEILDQLREFNFEPDECPDVDTYILWLQARFITMTSRACDLPAGDTERRARAIIDYYVSIGGMRKLVD